MESWYSVVGRACLTFLLPLLFQTSAWAQCEVTRVTADSQDTVDDFGASTDISGNFAIVGAPNAGAGAAFVYERGGLDWVQVAQLVPDGTTLVAGDDYGSAVAIDGPVAVVGARYRQVGSLPEQGVVFTFRRDPLGEWVFEQELTYAGGIAGDNFGHAVDISGDWMVIGAPKSDDAGGIGDSGTALAFRYDGSQWTFAQKLRAADDYENDRFGDAVAIDGNWIAVGAKWDDDGCPADPGCNSGSVTMFFEDPATGPLEWVQQDKLTAQVADGTQVGARSDFFGSALAIHGNRIVVGAYGHDSAASGAGAAFVYQLEGLDWVIEQRLTASDAVSSDDLARFGLAIRDDLIIACARDGDGNDPPVDGSGAAYFFERSGTSWTEVAKASASNAAAGDRFGTSAAIEGDYAIIGATRAGMADEGAAYIFAVGTEADCDNNGIHDDCDLLNNPALDVDGDGVLDSCRCDTDDDCADVVPCVGVTCDQETHLCVYSTNPGSCLIDGVCYGDGEPNPVNPCEWCNAGTLQDGWSAGCVQDGVFCNGPELCDGGACVSAGDPCTAPRLVCDANAEANGACSCEGDATCDDGLYCNGMETCGPDGSCQSSGNPCEPFEVCNETLDRCECDGNDDCPEDGIFCNGEEICVAGECMSAGDPCAVPTPVCIEEVAACLCGTDADCSDDIFCNGEETCNERGICEFVRPPCKSSAHCVEQDDRCLECLTSADCDDRDLCTGRQSCAPDNTCVATFVSDCNSNGLEDSCDLAQGTSLDENGNGRPDECDEADGVLVYSNTQGTHVFQPGAGARVADDVSTLFGGSWMLNKYRIRITGGVQGGGGEFLAETTLYDGCPDSSAGGQAIPGTVKLFSGLSDDAAVVHDLETDFSDRGVCTDDSACLVSKQDCLDGSSCLFRPLIIPPTVWLRIRVNTNSAGILAGTPAQVGFSEDGYDAPFGHCVQNFGGWPEDPHGSFWIELYAKPPQACDIDEDCDDGTYCNGREVCGTSGFCELGTRPCDEELGCDESTDRCYCNNDATCDDLEPCTGIESCGPDGLCISTFRFDCNDNGVEDSCEVPPIGDALDCNDNGVPDDCEQDADCNKNGTQDLCDIASGTSADCNANDTPDECELGPNDCDGNLVPDECDPDCNANDIPDACESNADCNENGTQDICDLATGTSGDCNDNAIPDDCELENNDCNSTGVPDDCEFQRNDCNRNFIPDDCELEKNDCDLNGVPDECDVAKRDCNASGMPDACELADNDCNGNGEPDDCDVTGTLIGANDNFAFEFDLLGGSARTLSRFGWAGQDMRRTTGLAYDLNADVFYACHRDFDQLITIDASTGMAGNLGPIGFDSVRGLAFDANTNTLYGVDERTDQLITIDLDTGAGMAVGALGFARIEGLAFDPNGNTLYGSDWYTDELVTIDTITGEATAIGSFGISDITGLAFDRDSSTLYGATDPGSLYTIDVSTGAVQFLHRFYLYMGSLTVNDTNGRLYTLGHAGRLHSIDVTTEEVTEEARLGLEYVTALAFDSNSDVLYAVDMELGPDLFCVDTTSGTASLVKALNGGWISGMAIDSDGGVVYGITTSITSNLVSINISTGAVTNIGSLSPRRVSSLAFDGLNNRLLGVDIDTNEILAINPANADTSIVGETGFRVVQGLAFDPASNSLYSSDHINQRLIRIDPGTGAGTVVGDMGLNVSNLAYDSNSGTLYGNADNLVRINVTTGRASAIGHLGFSEISAMAFDPKTETTYGAASGIHSSNLIAIDSATGEGTLINKLGFAGIIDLVFDQDVNSLIAIHHRGQDEDYNPIVQLDTTTGAGTVLSNVDFGETNGRRIAYDSNTNTLYGIARPSSTDQLVVIDRMTGDTTAIGFPGQSFNRINAIEFDSIANVLYAATDDGSWQEVNTSNGESNFIGGLPSPIRSMAFDAGSNTMYGVTATDFVVIESTTGGITIVGPTNGSALRLAFDSNKGLLYGNDGSRLLEIDTATGVQRVRLLMGLSQIRGLAWDSNANVLYGATFSDLFTIGIQTETIGSYVGAVGFDYLASLAFDPQTDSIYATRGSVWRPNELIRIDKETGHGTAVGPIGYYLDGLTFDHETGTLLGTRASTGELLAIGTSTGEGAIIDNTRFLGVTGLAFVPSRETDCNNNETPDSCESPGIGDFDYDGNLTLLDLHYLADCLWGPEVATSTACTGLCVNAFDADDDGDVDLRDVSLFLAVFAP